MSAVKIMEAHQVSLFDLLAGLGLIVLIIAGVVLCYKVNTYWLVYEPKEVALNRDITPWLESTK
jgi:hypothetical protein